MYAFLLGGEVDPTGMHRTEDRIHTHMKHPYHHPIEYVYVIRYTAVTHS